MKIVLLEDDPLFLKKLESTILDYFNKVGTSIELVSYESIPDDIDSNVDAYFLDIEINGELSYSYAEKIRRVDQRVPIVFVTSYQTYINSSVKLHIFDYIRKYHFEEEIQHTLNELYTYIKGTKEEIVITSYRKKIRIIVDEVLYIETYSHNCIIHTTSGDYKINKGITTIIDKNNPYFVKSHKSCQVNMTHVQSVSSSQIILSNGVRLPLGRNYIKAIHEKFLELQV